MKCKPKLLAIASALTFVAASAHATNLLQNPGFEQPNGDGFGEVIGIDDGDSGAADWGIINYNNGTTTTQEVTPPSGLDNSGEWSLYVTSTVAGNGIWQGSGANQFYGSVSGWVYLVQGSVGIATTTEDVHGGVSNPQVYVSTTITNQWVYLYADTNVDAYSFDVLALSPNTEFYADNMDADNQPTPEPASLAFLGVGCFGLLARRKQGKRD
jgi:hypothetical protein